MWKLNYTATTDNIIPVYIISIKQYISTYRYRFKYSRNEKFVSLQSRLRYRITLNITR